jgi:hypothetical protein
MSAVNTDVGVRFALPPQCNLLGVTCSRIASAEYERSFGPWDEWQHMEAVPGKV